MLLKSEFLAKRKARIARIKNDPDRPVSVQCRDCDGAGGWMTGDDDIDDRTSWRDCRGCKGKGRLTMHADEASEYAFMA